MLSAAGMAPKAAVADDETVGTHLPTTQPEWVSELLSLAKKDFGKVSSEEFGAVLKKVESAWMTGPLCNWLAYLTNSLAIIEPV